MARKKSSGKMAWVLLALCLLMGGGGSGVRAEEGPGVQLVVALDSANPAGDRAMAQAAGLLVHLLGDQDYLGLVRSGEPDGELLPTDRLTPEHRRQALDKLAHLPPAEPAPKPLSDSLQQTLSAFQPQGPQRRLVFWLAGSERGLSDQENHGASQLTEKIAAPARSAGVPIFAGLVAPATPVAADWQTLASETGGRVWEVKQASDLHLTCLKLYQYLDQPQEVPLNRGQVRLDKWVKQAVIVMARAAANQGVVLTSPKKARITRRTRAKNIRWVAGRSYDLITLTRPRPGVWSFTGARPEASRVFLSTELILTAAGTPREVGEDEALQVTAALHNAKGSPLDPDLSAMAEFAAGIQLNDLLLTTELKKSRSDEAPESAPGARIGRFPPLRQEGEGTLRLIALGKDFQRLRVLPLTITKPWYQLFPPAQETQAGLPLRFKPDPGRLPEQVAGTLTLKAAQGSLSGAFINPAPGADIVLALSPGEQVFSSAALHLDGTAPDGRPLDITSGPFGLKTSQRDPDCTPQPPVRPELREKVQRENTSSPTHRLWRHWVWLALCIVGGVIILISVFLLWRLRRETEVSEDEEELGGAAPQSTLRLKAQVETLTREKVELEAAVKEKNRQAKQLQAEKEEMQAALERLQQKSQANSKALGDLEKKLQEAEQEALRVKQEYMALYARNQQEKEVLKRN